MQLTASGIASLLEECVQRPVDSVVCVHQDVSSLVNEFLFRLPRITKRIVLVGLQPRRVP